MTIDASALIAALLGGALIGISAVLLMLGIGRIAGVSGIFNGAIDAGTRDRAWRWAFIAALAVGAWLAHVAGWVMPSPAPPPGTAWTLVGGLLVGYGTRLGGGCTSGHGVCGLARLSQRSLVATLTFMATGIVTVFIVRHVVGVTP